MTNPSQLKYLEAMGIPVWISRDLVIEKSRERSDHVIQTDTHVDSILNDLEKQANKPETPSIPVILDKPLITPLKGNIQDLSTEPEANEIGKSALHTIYACGNLQADWLVIGESPELISNRQNQPFSNDNGVLLTNMLRAVGLANPRETAYLVNIIKSSVEVTTELEQQSSAELNKILLSKIAQIKPKMILVVGQIAAQRLLRSKEPLARLRGKEYTLPNTQIPLIVTYYPSYLLSKPLDKRKAWEDLKFAMRILAK